MHYKRFREILYSPSVLNLSSDIADSLSATLGSAIKPSEADSTAAETLNSQPQTETETLDESSANHDLDAHLPPPHLLILNKITDKTARRI